MVVPERKPPPRKAAASGSGLQSSERRKPIDTPASLDFLRGDFEPELLFQRPGHCTPDRVTRPFECGGDLVDGRAVRRAQHGDQGGLLGAFETQDGPLASDLMLRFIYDAETAYRRGQTRGHIA